MICSRRKAAELRQHRQSGLRIDDALLPPPALLLQDGDQIVRELIEGLAVADGVIDRVRNIAEHIEAGAFRHGEGLRMLLLPQVEPGERRQRIGDAALRRLDRLFRRDVFDLGLRIFLSSRKPRRPAPGGVVGPGSARAARAWPG